MANNEELSDEVFWKNKIKEHWKTFAIMIAAGICVMIGALLVVIWFIETSTLGGMGEWTFNDWTLNYVVGFIILIILWELLFVGIPTGLFFGIGGYLWWRRLPDEEKQEFKDRDKKEKEHKGLKTGGGGGGFGLVMFIAFCMYVAIDGKYNTKFGALNQFGDPIMPYSYFIYSWLLTFMWMIIVLGIPAGIVLLIVYFTVWRKKTV